jgi:gluconokinase
MSNQEHTGVCYDAALSISCLLLSGETRAMRVFVLIGMSGSGKSTVGIHAAAHLAWPYLEGDDFHPAQNIEKMSCGIPLSDADLGAWIDTLARAINSQMRLCVIVSCSVHTHCALQRLEEAVQRPLSFIRLCASPDVLANRLKRHGHRMSTAPSTTPKTPAGAITIDADGSVSAVTAMVIAHMRQLSGLYHPGT